MRQRIDHLGDDALNRLLRQSLQKPIDEYRIERLRVSDSSRRGSRRGAHLPDSRIPIAQQQRQGARARIRVVPNIRIADARWSAWLSVAMVRTSGRGGCLAGTDASRRGSRGDPSFPATTFAKRDITANATTPDETHRRHTDLRDRITRPLNSAGAMSAYVEACAVGVVARARPLTAARRTTGSGSSMAPSTICRAVSDNGRARSSVAACTTSARTSGDGSRRRTS